LLSDSSRVHQFVPCWESLHHSPRHPSWFKGGPASKGRGVEEKGRKGIGEGEDRRKEGKGWKKVGEGRERKVEERRMEGKGRREEK